MSTYNTGTVSVSNGNAVVTGTGTAWAVALVAGGMFSSAGLSVPIASVDSNTQITLDYAWPGTTASGATYSIALENSDAATVVSLNSTLSRVLVNLSLAGINPNASGTIAERDAIVLGTGDKGFLFLYAELGHPFAFYRWTGTAWDGPFSLQGTPGLGAGGYGLALGGTTGQFLRKASGTDGDSTWATPAASAISNDSGVSGSAVKDALNSLNSSIALAAANVAKRGTVRAATTANVTISTALNNGDAIDGVTLATGDLVLVKSQTAPAENGIYVVGVAPARSSEFDTYNEHPGALIVVQEGTTLADTFWYCTSNVGGTLGTTAIAYSQMSVLPADGSITNAKLANMANATFKGRTTAGTGVPEDLTIAQLKGLLLSSVVIREVLTANRIYYVRTDGSDSNSGLANTSGGAFLTIQKAFDTICTIDLNGFVATVQIADGTYTSALAFNKPWVGGNLVFQGNNGTPANVLLSVTSANAISSSAALSGSVTVQDMKIQTTTAGTGILHNKSGLINISNIDFGACVTSHIQCFGPGADIFVAGNYTISGGSGRHMEAGEGGRIVAASRTVTLTGTPAFSVAFASAQRLGLLMAQSMTLSGSATGARYSALNGGGIFTGGGGANYFPGNAAGTATSPGWYA